MVPVLSSKALFRVIASLVAAERAVQGSGHAWDCARWDETTALGNDSDITT